MEAAGTNVPHLDASLLERGRHQQAAVAAIRVLLGDFTRPTVLTRWLAAAPAEGEWTSAAARDLSERLGS